MDSYSLEARKRRWREHVVEGRPGHLFMIAYTEGAPVQPLPWPELRQSRVEWAWQSYRWQRERAAWLHDDALPYLHVHTGTEIFAEAFGCRVYYPDDSQPFARPCVHTAAEATRLRVPEVSSSPLAYLFDLADELRRRAGPEALLRIIDLQSPMDVAALIWDKNDFYAAMLTEPEAVQELAAKVMALQVAFLDQWFSRYGREFIAHYPEYYLPYGVSLSEDEIGCVSQALFPRFFAPHLTALSERYGAIGVHCCADARHQWGNLLSIPNLRVLNLVQPEPVLRESYAYFAPHLLQCPDGAGVGPPREWPAQYPPGSRVVMRPPASTKPEAQALADRLWQACGRP